MSHIDLFSTWQPEHHSSVQLLLTQSKPKFLKSVQSPLQLDLCLTSLTSFPATIAFLLISLQPRGLLSTPWYSQHLLPWLSLWPLLDNVLLAYICMMHSLGSSRPLIRFHRLSETCSDHSVKNCKCSPPPKKLLIPPSLLDLSALCESSGWTGCLLSASPDESAGFTSCLWTSLYHQHGRLYNMKKNVLDSGWILKWVSEWKV